jgi:uncharacterized protein
MERYAVYYAPEPGSALARFGADTALAQIVKLVETAQDVILGNDHFVLLNEQMDAYNAVFEAIETAQSTDDKSIVVIRGGAGSSKSAVALQLVRAFIEQGLQTVLTV